MKTFNESQILELDGLYELQDTFCSSGIAFNYVLSDGEKQWLGFVDGKYSIADWINENLSDCGNVLNFECCFSMSSALDDDCGGCGKAVCLSDESALQKLFFWLYEETENND